LFYVSAENGSATNRYFGAAFLGSTVTLAPASTLSPALVSQLLKAALLQKWPLGQLISIFENATKKAYQNRHDVISFIESNKFKFPKVATICGFTGTPGAGKSTLIGELALHLLSQHDSLSIAILAVDPSSQVSGGSFLGDRTRVNAPYAENRLFFRSQASNLEFGGISQNTFQVVRLLRHLFDFIFIETVGIGQSEIEIQRLSHHTCLVMQPLAGDQVQFMKAGIMEIPDAFIVNKCDEKILAQRSLNLLKTSLYQARVVEDQEETLPPIFLTSAIKKKGIDLLAEHLLRVSDNACSFSDFSEQEMFYFRRWITHEFGQFGLQWLERFAHKVFGKQCTYEQMEQTYIDLIMESLGLSR
jgi:LAO/AO transport system kinase